ncbi:uncharacterized protein GrlHz [Cloeon dipterum]|uniref:uncharacterized protein GrlHz n=1 Tax=Cloeon dipterum TaxID=197152 RepID=UPI00321FB225
MACAIEQGRGIKKSDVSSKRCCSPSYISAVDILSSSEIVEVSATSNEENVAVALNYCKSRVVVPYLKLLAAVGLRPLACGTNRPTWCITSLGLVLLALMLALLLTGYTLQFLSCFRRDLGPLREKNRNETNDWVDFCPMSQMIFSFAIPSFLHLCTYLYMLCMFRVREVEKLPHLMERVFVVSSPPGNQMQLKKLTTSLWLLLAIAFTWLVMSMVTFSLALWLEPPNFHWIPIERPVAMRLLLASGTIVQDAVQSILVSGYCLQAHLLTLFAAALRQRILKRNISLLDWMREVREFLELLRHLNNCLAPAVCVLALLSSSWALSGFITIIRRPEYSSRLFVAALLVLLWATLATAPFFMATRLSKNCSALRDVGHEIRAKPFLYMDSSTEELDSLLLFSSTLRLKPRLFGTPVSGQYFCVFIALIALATLVVGQLT